MCVSLGPARFSGTIVYAGEVSALGVHVLGYQNSVRNVRHPLARILGRWRPGPTGNAMLLHFPAAEPMTEANLLDTRDCPRILDDMARALTPPPPPDESDLRSLGGMADAVVFTRGIYDVVLARDARYVPEALERVRPDKRPPLADAIFRAYSEWFPEWPVALCCFSNLERLRAEPLLWWYRPRNPAVLFAPALDAHDGRPPDPDEHVPADHTVILGSDRLAAGSPVRFSDILRAPDAEPDILSRQPPWIIEHPARVAEPIRSHRLWKDERRLRFQAGRTSRAGCCLGRGTRGWRRTAYRRWAIGSRRAAGGAPARPRDRPGSER